MATGATPCSGQSPLLAFTIGLSYDGLALSFLPCGEPQPFAHPSRKRLPGNVPIMKFVPTINGHVKPPMAFRDVQPTSHIQAHELADRAQIVESPDGCCLVPSQSGAGHSTVRRLRETHRPILSRTQRHCGGFRSKRSASGSVPSDSDWTAARPPRIIRVCVTALVNLLT